MSIIKVINNLFKKKSNNFNIHTFGGLQSAVNYDVFVGWTFASINERAKGFSRKRLYFERELDFETSEPFEKNYWLNYLMRRPNDYVSWYQIKNLACKWLDLNGNAYLWTPINTTVPSSIWVLPSDRVKPEYSSQGGISHYRFTGVDGVKLIPKNEICHIKTLSPSASIESNFYLGKPELVNAAMDAILSEAEKQRFIKDYLKRDMTDPYVITSDDYVHPEEWQRWILAFNERMPNSYKVKALLDGGKHIESMTKNNTSINIDFEEIKQQITAIFGVPIGLLTGELSNRATAEVLEWRFETNTIEPITMLFAEELTRHFKQFDNDIVWTFKPYTTADPYFDLELKKFRIDYGISTPAEIAREDGYIVSDEAEVENEVEIENEVELNVKSIEFDKKEYWLENFKSVKKHEIVLRNIITREFKSLLIEVAENLENQKYYKKSLGIFLKIDVDKWYIRFKSRMTPRITLLSKDIIKQAIRRIGGVESDFDLAVKNAVNESTAKIRDSLNTVQSNLRDEVKKVVDDNPALNKEQLINLIKDKINIDYMGKLNNRVNMIAQTTSTVAVGVTQKTAYENRGYTSVWLSRRDGRVRESHLDADGQKPDELGYFNINGDRMKSPGTGQIAKENVNCRCTLFPIKDN